MSRRASESVSFYSKPVSGDLQKLPDLISAHWALSWFDASMKLVVLAQQRGSSTSTPSPPTSFCAPSQRSTLTYPLSDVKDAITVWPVVSFHRIKRAKARHAQEVESPGGIPSLEAEFRRDYVFFVYPSAIGASETRYWA
ncbi:hypothetical protein M405DRAFT_866829 [Rhizopogon salebrosus TDB-379]|nr:hypothetical protein M405DRAFT_866829 [Rhizopogon salebrosus TDB-379]